MSKNDSDIYIAVLPIWFSGTIGDTNDISTKRGSSLALLFAPDALLHQLKTEFASIEVVVNAASQLILRLGCEAAKADATAGQIVGKINTLLSGKLKLVGNVDSADCIDMAYLRHCVVSHIINAETAPAQRTCQFAIEVLKAKSVARQMHIPSVQYMPQRSTNSHSAKNVCSLDQVSPAGSTSKSDRALDIISETVRQRREFGRERKSDFYTFVLDRSVDDEVRKLAETLRNKKVVFSQSLDDLTVFDFSQRDIDDFKSKEISEDGFADRKLELPAQLANKIAIVYMDGNKFGKLFENCKTQSEIVALSEQLQGFQSVLMADILTWTMSMGLDPVENDMIAPPRYFEERGKFVPARVRFETLLWGGDEMMFALPAWRAWEFMSIVEASLKKFMMVSKNDGITRKRLLSHAVSLVFANVKTPIASMEAMAGQLADMAKIHYETDSGQVFLPFAWQVGISEGMDVSASDILGARQKLFAGLEAADLAFWDNLQELATMRDDDLAKTRVWDALTEQISFLGKHLGQSQINQLLSGLIENATIEEKNKIIKDNIARVALKGREVEQELIDKLRAAPLNPHKEDEQPDLEKSLLWLRYLNGYVLPVARLSSQSGEAAGESA